MTDSELAAAIGAAAKSGRLNIEDTWVSRRHSYMAIEKAASSKIKMAALHGGSLTAAAVGPNGPPRPLPGRHQEEDSHVDIPFSSVGSVVSERLERFSPPCPTQPTARVCASDRIINGLCQSGPLGPDG